MIRGFARTTAKPVGLRVRAKLDSPLRAGRIVYWAYRKRAFGVTQASARYVLLASVSFAFLLPVIYMVTTALKTLQDFLDPGIKWVPTRLAFDNLTLAYAGMHFPEAARNSLTIAILAVAGQMLSCSLAGYAFARMKFPGREYLFLLALFSFLVPPETVVVPLFILFRKLGWVDTFYPFIVPAFWGQGLRGALFVIIFRQFFRRLPWELEDAAQIDGCSEFGTYFRIMLPLAKPAVLVSFLFSFVWHWNEFFLPMMFLSSTEHFTLPLRLSVFWTSVNELVGGKAGELVNQPMMMAASLYVVAPMLILYVFTQRYFVEGVERTGLVD